MAFIAAFDTSSESGSIALLEGDRLVAELNAGGPLTHSTWLVDSFRALLVNSGADMRDISFFAVSAGPGSFTGLRIGVTAVKGLAWALGKKVCPVSSLKALAMNLACSPYTVCPVLDARRGEVYAALYKFAGAGPEAVIEASALSPRSLFENIRGAVSGPVLFLGNGAGAYAEQIKSNVKDAVIAPAPLWNIRAFNVGLMAYREEPVDPTFLSPSYLRRPEAVIKASP